MSKTVRVECGIPNGMSLQLWKRGYDDGTGFHPMIRDGSPVILNGPSSTDTGVGNTERPDLPFGVTEVDAEFWSAWLAQNEKNPAFGIGQIRAAKDQPEEVDKLDPNPPK